jgi:hypothetical protein
MAVYLISYDLKKPGQNYDLLYDALKNASSWWHYLESTWLIDSHESIDAWQRRIQSRIDANDCFLIVELNSANAYTGWLPKEAWVWMNQRLGR